MHHVFDDRIGDDSYRHQGKGIIIDGVGGDAVGTPLTTFADPLCVGQRTGLILNERVVIDRETVRDSAAITVALL